MIDSTLQGFRFDPRSNYGINFTESVNGNTYQGWEKLASGEYVKRDLIYFTLIIQLILEINLGIRSSDGYVYGINNNTGIITYSSTNRSISQGLRYDPQSNYGVDFSESEFSVTFQPWVADSKGYVTAVEMSSISPNILILLQIQKETVPEEEKRINIPTVPVVYFTPDPTLLYRVTDTGATTSGNFISHFDSPTEIILDGRIPNFDTDGNISGFGSNAPSPLIGSSVQGPFVQSGTVVISVININSIPSNSSVSGQIITLSQPLVNIKENINDVFTYTFSKNIKNYDESDGFLFKQDPTLIYRITDIGSDSNNTFVSHFPTSTKILFDSRKPVIDGSGNIINFGTTARTPQIGSIVSGPFVSKNTTVIGIENINNIPSNSSIPGQIITLSNPLKDIVEDDGQIFVYTFQPPPSPSGEIILLNPALSYRVTHNGYNSLGQFTSHFLSPTEIILDGRQPILRVDGADFSSNVIATGPVVGQTINGPFIAAKTTVVSVRTLEKFQNDSSVPFQVVTISKPLVNISEEGGDVFTYIFSETIQSFEVSPPQPPPQQTQQTQQTQSPPQQTPPPASGPLLYRVTDNGYTATGHYATHFPTFTQIVLDSREPIFDGNGNLINFGSRANTPKIGSTINGPFIQPGTVLLDVIDTPTMPSNPYVGGQVITISKPIQNMREDRGDVFTYTFTQ